MSTYRSCNHFFRFKNLALEWKKWKMKWKETHKIWLITSHFGQQSLSPFSALITHVSTVALASMSSSVLYMLGMELDLALEWKNEKWNEIKHTKYCYLLFESFFRFGSRFGTKFKRITRFAIDFSVRAFATRCRVQFFVTFYAAEAITMVISNSSDHSLSLENLINKVTNTSVYEDIMLISTYMDLWPDRRIPILASFYEYCVLNYCIDKEMLNYKLITESCYSFLV